MKIVALFRDKNKMTARKIRVFLCWSGYETMGDYIKRIFNGLDKLYVSLQLLLG